MARDSTVGAGELVLAAREAARSFALFPEASPMVPEFDDPTIRETFVKKRYRLIYQIGDEMIWVIAFIDGARDLNSLWNREEREVDP